VAVTRVTDLLVAGSTELQTIIVVSSEQLLSAILSVAQSVRRGAVAVVVAVV
jgi:hypothetical protein